MSGVDLLTVTELMGHKTMEMTLRYAHLSPEHKHDAVEALRFLDGHKAHFSPIARSAKCMSYNVVPEW